MELTLELAKPAQKPKPYLLHFCWLSILFVFSELKLIDKIFIQDFLCCLKYQSIFYKAYN